MLQAILLSENDNGPYEYWNKEAMATSDESEAGDGYDTEKGSEQASRFFNTYFAPYIKYLRLEKTDKCSTGLRIIFNDGSHACLKNGGCIDFIFDVNGDRKPTPTNVNCKDYNCMAYNKYKYSDPLGLKLSDVFTIMITDKEAIPYGVAAQRAMYQAQAKK